MFVTGKFPNVWCFILFLLHFQSYGVSLRSGLLQNPHHPLRLSHPSPSNLLADLQITLFLWFGIAQPNPWTTCVTKMGKTMEEEMDWLHQKLVEEVSLGFFQKIF